MLEKEEITQLVEEKIRTQRVDIEETINKLTKFKNKKIEFFEIFLKEKI